MISGKEGDELILQAMRQAEQRPDDRFPWDSLVREWPAEVPGYMIYIDGKKYYATREEAITAGVLRDYSKPPTLRDRIREKMQDWHSRMAVWHERRSIGLK